MARNESTGKRIRKAPAAKLGDGELGSVRGGCPDPKSSTAAGRQPGQSPEPGPIRTRGGIMIDFSDDA